MEKIKYWFWKNWFLAGFSSSVRPIAEMRVILVYDVEFRNNGLESVKKIHSEYVDKIRNEMKKGHAK